MTSTSTDGKERHIKDLEEARTELRASIQGLTDGQMLQPGAVGEWSVKDVLSHITSWEEFALPDLARLARGDVPILASMGDLESANYDGPNRIVMALRKNLPLDQVMRELDLVHAEFVEAVLLLSESVLAEGQFGGGLVGISAEHDREHARHIIGWRKNARL